jgi:hypothetical protein
VATLGPFAREVWSWLLASVAHKPAVFTHPPIPRPSRGRACGVPTSRPGNRAMWIWQASKEAMGRCVLTYSNAAIVDGT